LKMTSLCEEREKVKEKERKEETKKDRKER
jgi:hypothetical protein